MRARIASVMNVTAVTLAPNCPAPARPSDATIAAAAALNTSLGPRFAAAAASRAGGTQEHLNRHDSAPLRLFTRKTDFRFERFGALARTLREECLADAGDEMSDRWKIDRDLVSKT